jgi:hypothetical protein
MQSRLCASCSKDDPAVVVYDIGAPYEENRAMFQQLRATSMRDWRFVITSVHPSRVERLTGRDGLDDIAHAVKEAARARRIIPGTTPAIRPAGNRPRSRAKQPCGLSD